MDPSRYRHRAMIQDYVEVKDSVYGQNKSVWSDILEVWCSIEVLVGQEKVLPGPGQTYAVIDYHIECRYPGFNITPVMRFKWTDGSGAVHLMNVSKAYNVEGRYLLYELEATEQFDNTQ